MTTIIGYRDEVGGHIIADRAINTPDGLEIARYAKTKLIKHKNILYAFSGQLRIWQLLINLIENRYYTKFDVQALANELSYYSTILDKDENYPYMNGKLMIVTDKTIAIITNDFAVQETIRTFAIIGSGTKYAVSSIITQFRETNYDRNKVFKNALDIACFLDPTSDLDGLDAFKVSTDDE
jgi:ATP-dependent protease HslVU (ClpYQ) peptidase subunit